MDFEFLKMLTSSDGTLLEKVVAGVILYYVARRDFRAEVKKIVAEGAATREVLSELAESVEQIGKQLVDHGVRIGKLEEHVERIKNPKGGENGF